MKSNYRSIFTQLVETCLGSWERERENKTFRERTIITTRSTTRTNSFVPPYIYVLSKLPFPNLPRFLVPYESIDDHDLPRRNRGWHTSGQCDLPVSDKPTLFASFFFSLPLSSCSRGVDNSPRNSTHDFLSDSVIDRTRSNDWINHYWTPLDNLAREYLSLSLFLPLSLSPPLCLARSLFSSTLPRSNLPFSLIGKWNARHPHSLDEKRWSATLRSWNTRSRAARPFLQSY